MKPKAGPVRNSSRCSTILRRERLECSAKIVRRLAHALGQSKKLIDEIEAGKVHPAMAAYGLWKNETDLAGLDDRVKKNRKRSSSRPIVEL